MEFTGFDGSVLTLLTQYPDYQGFRDLIPRLGPDAQKRAEKIVEEYEKNKLVLAFSKEMSR